MSGKCREIPRLILTQKYLGTDGVTGGPPDEIPGHGDGAFGLAGDVAGDKGHGEVLGGPEGEDDVVRDEKAGFGRGFVVVDNGEEDDGSDERGNDVEAHDGDVLAGTFDEVGGGEEDDYDDGT